MKKCIVAVVCLMLVFLAGCGGASAPAASLSYKPQDSGDKNVMEIRDKFFIQQCTDIYLNPEDYEDKIIKLEGVYSEWYDDDEIQHLIYRLTPGCCGDDGGEVGFDFIYDGEMPAIGDWISVVGTIELVDEFVILNVSELTVSEDRGEVLVMN